MLEGIESNNKYIYRGVNNRDNNKYNYRGVNNREVANKRVLIIESNNKYIYREGVNISSKGVSINSKGVIISSIVANKRVLNISSSKKEGVNISSSK
ncbi:hypothetical protein CWI38_1280p0030 [Hamiltosporidium tvaerminnensis]|uniref:Uncharacterized protein n=1 Tax=Hamiltosporidium tvaerminnensis TaxID=1176355 RepID=A0A4Q9LS64_9MICR|nr:hypothetical protein CWI38_1280p0030 [Hamiltosporidium tvaerminnensis]